MLSSLHCWSAPCSASRCLLPTFEGREAGDGKDFKISKAERHMERWRGREGKKNGRKKNKKGKKENRMKGVKRK